MANYPEYLNQPYPPENSPHTGPQYYVQPQYPQGYYTPPLYSQEYYPYPPVKQGMKSWQVFLLVLGIVLFTVGALLAAIAYAENSSRYSSLVGWGDNYMDYDYGYDPDDDSWYENNVGNVTYDVRGNWYGYDDEEGGAIYYVDNDFGAFLYVFEEPLVLDIGSNSNKLTVFVETFINESPYGEEIEQKMIEIDGCDAVQYSFHDVYTGEKYLIDCITILDENLFTTVMFASVVEDYESYEEDISYVFDSIAIEK